MRAKTYTDESSDKFDSEGRIDFVKGVQIVERLSPRNYRAMLSHTHTPVIGAHWRGSTHLSRAGFRPVSRPRRFGRTFRFPCVLDYAATGARRGAYFTTALRLARSTPRRSPCRQRQNQPEVRTRDSSISSLQATNISDGDDWP